jgi:hypothetical protein
MLICTSLFTDAISKQESVQDTIESKEEGDKERKINLKGGKK